MDNVLLAVFGGLPLGATYALIALGLVLVYRTTGTFNLAHGQLMLLGAFVLASWQQHSRGPFVLGLLIGLAVAGIVAVVLYVLVLKRTVGQPHWVAFVATLVLGQLLDAAMSLYFSAPSYVVSIPGMPKGAVAIFGVRVGQSELIIAGIGVLLALVFIAALRYTRLGIQVRAAGQDPVLASQGGIQVRSLYVGSWVVAGILAALAGVLYGSTTVVDSSMSGVALIAIPAMVLGGLDSFEGAVVGGLIVGVIQGFITVYIGGQYVNAATYSFLLVLLLVLPRGLFGTKEVVKI
ncbi:branched-chain amino acid ABC transporter permease [Dactylosporangium sp. NPDC000555]|uniref:branched-chain amino acid ABC transporter permease n=1 Tax=Dactylosporangium sp. NPDC000555 TaxID=3154260 RepID=UPI003332726C